MKEKIYKALVILGFLMFAAAAILNYGCDGGGGNPAGPSSGESCAGYAGGDERGKWKARNANFIREYTGSVERDWRENRLEWEGSYKKPQYNKITVEINGRVYYNCFEVIGNTMRMSDGYVYYDRI